MLQVPRPERPCCAMKEYVRVHGLFSIQLAAKARPLSRGAKFSCSSVRHSPDGFEHFGAGIVLTEICRATSSFRLAS